MAQLFNHGHGWETLDQIRARKAREPEELKAEPTSESEPEKLDREAIKAELTALGVKFRGNAKTESLQELLINAKAEPTSESEQ